MPAVARPLRAGDDERRAIVGLDATVQQMQRLADDAARQHLGDADPMLVQGFGIVRSMLAVDRLDGGHLLGPRAVIVHVAHEGRAEHLARALPAIGAAVQHVARHGSHRARAGAADADLGEAVHGAEDHDGLAHAGLDQAHRHADQRFRRGAAAEHVHVEIEPDAEVARDERREGRIARLVGQHAIDIGRFQSGSPRWRCARPMCRARASSSRSRAYKSSRRHRRWRTCRADAWDSWYRSRPASAWRSPFA